MLSRAAAAEATTSPDDLANRQAACLMPLGVVTNIHFPQEILANTRYTLLQMRGKS
jgi:hypothetical protein